MAIVIIQASCKFTSALLTYLEKQGIPTLPLLEAFDYPEEYLFDSHSWLSLQDAESIFEKAARFSLDNQIGRSVGLQIPNLEALGALDNVFKMMTEGARAYYSRLDRFFSYFLAPQPIYNEVENSVDHLKFEFPLDKTHFPHLHDFLTAMLEVMPKYTGHPASQIKIFPTNEVEINWQTQQTSLFDDDATGRVLNPKLIDQMAQMLEESERKIESLKLENKRLQDRMREQVSTHSLTVLASGVAHEINNPIAFVTSNLSRFKEYFDALKKYVDATENTQLKNSLDLSFILTETPLMLQESMEGLYRVKEIVRDLSALANPEQGRQEKKIKTDLNQLLESSVKVFSNQMKDRIKIKRQLKLDDKIDLYPVRMSQVFVNLLSNAVAAIAENGVIEVKTWAEKNQAMIEIKDSGLGMDEETAKQIFTPFFTTKSQGQGMGLGLSIAQSIVELHQGKISVKSQKGKGSTFTIQLPMTTGEAYA